MEELISIIVPVYKVEKYLRKSIESICKQAYSNLEIILVDDGSPDGCPAICDEYSQRDFRVKVIHKKNGGLSSARNAGIDAASGKYIAFVDGDDSIHVDFIRILYELCKKYKCDIAQCGFLMTDEESILLAPQQNMKVEVYDTKETMKDFCRDSNVTSYWVAWNKLYKRELFEDIRYPNGRIHEDMFTSHQLLWKARKTAVTNLYLYYYLQRKESLTGGGSKVRGEIDKIDALKAAMEFFAEKGLEDEFVYMLYKYYFTTAKVYEMLKEDQMIFDEGDSRDDILRSMKEKVYSAKKMLLESPYGDMQTKVIGIYPSLSKEEQESYRNIYGSRIAGTFVVSYGFPYDKIKRNSCIAIYGAGQVGKSYYSQIRDFGYARVVAWVDNSWKHYMDLEFPVSPIDLLLKCSFDYVVIAIQNEKIVNEVRDNLIGWGIDNSKIIFEPPVPILNNNILKNEIIRETRKLEKSSTRRWMLMNTPDHDNLGDHALTMGTIDYFRHYFPNEEIIEITGKQWDAFKEVIIGKIGKEDIIMIVGGGFMGDLWPVQDDRVKEILAAFKENRTIFLPQTFYYVDRFGSVMNTDKELYNGRKNILFLHREENSYRNFTEKVVRDFSRNKCFPDLALYLDQKQKNDKRDGVLICLRLDKESVSIETHKKLFNMASHLGRSVSAIDTLLERSVGRYERVGEVSNILEAVSGSELLITDRLHAMVFAVITGTPCIALDNLSHKVSGVYQWICELDYVTCVEAEKVDADLMREYLNKKGRRYDRAVLDRKFDEMADTIKNWAERDLPVDEVAK